MQTDQQSPTIQAVAGPGGKADNESAKRTKYRKEIRLNPRDTDVERIVENWNVSGDGARNVAAAIRLYDAILRGDLDSVRQQVPLLAPALAATFERPKPRKKRNAAPVLESFDLNQDQDSLIQGETQRDYDRRMAEMIPALATTCGIDPALNERELRRTADLIVRGGYLVEDLVYWHNQWWLVEDWRGRKGELPTLRDVREHLGKVKALRLVLREQEERYTAQVEADLAEWTAEKSQPEPSPRVVEMEATWPPERGILNCPTLRTEAQIRWDSRQQKTHWNDDLMLRHWEHTLPGIT